MKRELLENEVEIKSWTIKCQDYNHNLTLTNKRIIDQADEALSYLGVTVMALKDAKFMSLDYFKKIKIAHLIWGVICLVLFIVCFFVAEEFSHISEGCIAAAIIFFVIALILFLTCLRKKKILCIASAAGSIQFKLKGGESITKAKEIITTISAYSMAE